MFRYILVAAAALSLLSSSNACRCETPPPLSDCVVSEDQAALLVTMKCIKSIICDSNTGAAVADVFIDKVFKDNTGLGLTAGDMVTVRSITSGATCGIGSTFKAETQWIMFPRVPPASLPGGNISDVFSDGTVCDVGSANLETGICDFNIFEPAQNDIDELMAGCM